MSLWHKLGIILLAIVMLSSIVSAGEATSLFMDETECPDDTIQSVLMFAFIGIFMLAMLWFSEKMIRIPFFSILIGIGMLFYSFTLYACHLTLGYMTSAFGVGIILFKFFWRGNK